MVDVWQSREDVDETIVEIKEAMSKREDLPPTMIGHVRDSINESPPDLVRYFYTRLEEWTPDAVQYFEERI